MKSDDDATYAVTIKVDLASVRPHVSGPNDVKTITSVDVLSQKKMKVCVCWFFFNMEVTKKTQY